MLETIKSIFCFKTDQAFSVVSSLLHPCSYALFKSALYLSRVFHFLLLKPDIDGTRVFSTTSFLCFLSVCIISSSFEPRFKRSDRCDNLLVVVGNYTESIIRLSFLHSLFVSLSPLCLSLSVFFANIPIQSMAMKFIDRSEELS